MSEDEELEAISKLTYKYDIGTRVLVHGSTAWFWAKVVGQTYGSWGAFSNAIRQEYDLETEDSHRFIQVPENWLESVPEREEKATKIKRFKEKSKSCADEDASEALRFYASEMHRRLYPDEVMKMGQFFGGLNNYE